MDIFDGLGDLSTLDLSDNSITALTAGVFEDLDGSMQNLYLWSNGLTALPAEIFTGLTGLKGLDLSCNALTALDLTRFDPFASTLTYLDISNNSFTTPPTQTALRAKLTNSGLILYINQKTECGPPNDTGLSGLSISPGDLTPAFETATPPSFDAVVPHDASTATITITTVDPNAEIGPYTRNDKSLYDDNPNVSGWQVRLPSYRNTFEWEVRAANGVNATKYTLVVFRSRAPSSEAQLRSLELSRVPLGETFDRAKEMYMATTAAGETTVTATPLDSDATTVIKLNGTVDADGTVDLELGSDNVITVEVTAEDGTTKKTYTVTVTREAPDAAPAPRLPSVDDPNAIWLATLTVAYLTSDYYGYDSALCNLTDTAFTYLGDNASISSNSHFKDWGTLYTIDELDYSGGEFHLSLDRKFEHDTADNIFVVVGGTKLKFADASYAMTTHTYLWTIPNPAWVSGEEVKVKIVVLKDADGPENVTATTTLVATRVLVPTTTTYEDVYTTYDMTLTWSRSDDRRARGGLPGGVPAEPGAAVAEAAGEPPDRYDLYAERYQAERRGLLPRGGDAPGHGAELFGCGACAGGAGDGGDPGGGGLSGVQTARFGHGAEAGLEPGVHAGQPGCHHGSGGLGSQRRPVRAEQPGAGHEL